MQQAPPAMEILGVEGGLSESALHISRVGHRYFLELHSYKHKKFVIW